MNLAGKKILILDDDPDYRQRLSEDLMGLGCSVLTANSPTDALESLKCLPDLLIIDVHFSQSSAFQFLISAEQLALKPPVIFLAKTLNSPDILQALRFGAKEYFEKYTLNIQQLEFAIEKILATASIKTSVINSSSHDSVYRDQLEKANRELREHLRVLERDQTAGRRVQRRLMPKGLQTQDGYRVEHEIIPSLFLSGDFIDYALIKQRYLAFYLADVSGHGASSAFVTIWLKHVVSRMVREEGLFGDYQSFEMGCSQMLQQINRELIETRIGHHLTFFVGVIDTQTRQMRYVVAGHLPLPVLIEQGKACFLEGQGKPVGLFKDARWQIYHRQLPENFALVCFSDGVLELCDKKDLEEKESDLLQKLSLSTGSLESVCNTLAINKVKDNPDDIAILSVSRSSGLLN
ncbi:MAG: response regulator [Cellvibrio sp.]|nr:response regulator [Cellvibrio sp.]